MSGAGPARRVVAAAALLLLAGCTAEEAPPAAPAPVRPQWKQVALPVPPGPAGRLMVRDALRCGQRWYAAGGVATSTQETRPALWRTSDPAGAGGWAAVPIDTAGDYYAERSVISALGCRDGLVAAVGAKSGGAHGNPRVRTFYEKAGGTLAAVPSTDFELYGGARQVSVNRIAGGPSGWLIAGNRQGGAAVWTSPDATGFTIHEDVPGLANDAALATTAVDAMAVPGGWLVAGGGRPGGRADRDPLVWTSPDAAAWTRVPLPGTPDDESAHRLVRTPDGLVAVGVAGGSFAAWAAADPGGATGWESAVRFGATGTGVVTGVEAAALLDGPGRLVAATTGADGHRLWAGDLGGAGWRPVETPVAVGTGGFTATAVAGSGGTMLYLADDGTAGTVWTASFPDP